MALVNITELLEAMPSVKFRPLIQSPVLFQYHTASEPALGPYCVPGSVFP